MDRRDFFRISSGAAIAPLLLHQPSEGAAEDSVQSSIWDSGELAHLLPTVNDTEILIKASFKSPLEVPPVLSLGEVKVPGVMSDTAGQFWQFHAKGMQPGRTYRLSLLSGSKAGGKMLCAPWDLATFPDVNSRPKHVRVVFYTCAGGHEQLSFLPVATRRRLFRRALSFGPHAVVANGDHVYWDLRSPLTIKAYGPRAVALAGTFDRASPILGTPNESVLKRAVGPQIASIYGTEFRSTPVFLIQDDHDYYDNDDAYDEIVTFPPDHFMSQAARATQALYYPEFLPDAARPSGLPGASADGRARAVSESFGTLRYGRLLETLLYTVRRTMTMAGPSAVFLEDTVEAWLKSRMADPAVDHVVNAPSNPPGWTAGKWGEWYPDVLSEDGTLTLSVPKPYWQSGWVKQHDRLMTMMSAMRGRVPLAMSGDLHAIAIGRMTSTGPYDLSKNPVVTVLTGPIGTRPGGWPSGIRKIGAQPSLHLKMEEEVKPIEQHGFTLADFTTEKIVLRMFKWDTKTQKPEDIDGLQPFHTVELRRPA